MLESLKALGALAGLMKDKERLARAGESLRESLRAVRVEGEAGGGAARVVANGEMEVVEVELSPALAAAAASGDAGLAGRLVAEAANAALARAKEEARKALTQQAADLGLADAAGPLMGLLGR